MLNWKHDNLTYIYLKIYLVYIELYIITIQNYFFWIAHFFSFRNFLFIIFAKKLTCLLQNYVPDQEKKNKIISFFQKIYKNSNIFCSWRISIIDWLWNNNSKAYILYLFFYLPYVKTSTNNVCTYLRLCRYIRIGN